MFVAAVVAKYQTIGFPGALLPKTLLPVELSGKPCIVRLHIFDQTSVVSSGVR
jgi:hypothetical protein